MSVKPSGKMGEKNLSGEPLRLEPGNLSIRARLLNQQAIWLQIVKTYGFPVQTYGKTLVYDISNSEVLIKNPRHQMSSLDPFCVPM